MRNNSDEYSTSRAAADDKPALDLAAENPIYIFGEITEYSAEHAIRDILTRAAIPDSKSITMMIFSDGGSYNAAQAIVDVCRHISRRGTAVNAVATGAVAGNAALIWLAADDRYIMPYATVCLSQIPCRLDTHDHNENIRRIQEQKEAQRRMERRLLSLAGEHIVERLRTEGKVFLTPYKASCYGLGSMLR